MTKDQENFIEQVALSAIIKNQMKITEEVIEKMVAKLGRNQIEVSEGSANSYLEKAVNFYKENPNTLYYCTGKSCSAYQEENPSILNEIENLKHEKNILARPVQCLGQCSNAPSFHFSFGNKDNQCEVETGHDYLKKLNSDL